MAHDTPILGPDAALLGGSGPGATLRRWLLATRPMFLTASMLPVFIGVAWGYSVSGRFDLLATVLAFFATVCVHAASNVYNDVGDDFNGTDRDNSDRIYPFTGGSQFIQGGVMNAAEMRHLAMGLYAIAVALGIWLTLLKGPAILIFGLLGVAAGVLYSLPRVMLSGRGIGEAIIGIAFGVVPVVGAAWLQSGIVDGQVLLVSVPVSLWVSAILLMNEVPDRAADARAGKRTLPVRLGVQATRRIYEALQLGAALAIVIMAWRGLLPAAANALAVLLLPAAWIAARGISQSMHVMKALAGAIRVMLLIHALRSVGMIALILLR